METETTEDTGEFAGLPPEAPDQNDQQDQPEQERNGYHERVDLSGLPEDIRKPIEGRFGHLSHLMKKQSEKYERELREYRQVMDEQYSRIEELTSGFGTMVNQMQDQTYADTEASLKQQLLAAKQTGDVEAELEIQDKLIDLKAEKKLAAKQPQPKQQPRQQAQQDYGYDISDEDQAVVTAWQDERDDTGGILRPWAHCRTPDNPQADKAYIGALRETYSVLGNPRYANWSMEQKMAEVDRRMGVVQVQRKQSVMGGGLTGNRKSSKIPMNPKAEEIAVRMKLGGPKATREQHLEAYRKQLESTKGAR